eukprot:scaffold421285_cov56-Attheya_sp.AAC.9
MYTPYGGSQFVTRESMLDFAHVFARALNKAGGRECMRAVAQQGRACMQLTYVLQYRVGYV